MAPKKKTGPIPYWQYCGVPFGPEMTLHCWLGDAGVSVVPSSLNTDISFSLTTGGGGNALTLIGLRLSRDEVTAFAKALTDLVRVTPMIRADAAREALDAAGK
jgi:hypothetical protein